MSLVTIDRSRKPLELAIRKFIFCSYRVFDDVKNRSDELQNGTGDAKTATTSKQSVLCNGSRLFRDQISTLLSDIDVLQSTFFDEKDSEYLFQPEYDLAAYLNTTWHLCEIFFLNQTNSISLEVIQWFKMNGVLPVELVSSLQAFRTVVNPQLIAPYQMGADINGYWETVYALILEGRLLDAWEILTLHRELAALIGSNEGYNSAADRNVLEGIYDILTTHPYIHLVNALNTNNGNNDKSMNISPSITLEFTDWQEKISVILKGNSPLLGRISELNTVLLLLVGDKNSLVEKSCGEWTTLGIGLFLYVYPPPLIRSSISKIVESVMVLMKPKEGDDVHEEEIMKEIKQRETMRRIMNGDSSIVLKSLIESCGWGNSMKDFTSLFGIVSASHLTYLLAKSGVSSSNSSFLSSSDKNKTELLGELFSVGNSGKSSGSINLSETLPNEASFVEELFLESVQRINELQFPLEVVAGYLRVCPLKGLEYARVLLPQRRIQNDQTVHSICHVLRTFGLQIEASVLEASRGNWWLQQSERNGGIKSGGRVVKAMQFYQRAGDYDRTNALIDRALWRCCTALINASVALSSADSVESSSSSSLQKNKKQSSKYLFLIPRNLKLYPVRVRDAILLGEKSTCSHADHMDLRHYPESSHQAIGTEIETGDAIDLDTAVERLFIAIGDTEDLLGSLINPNSAQSPQAFSLKVFVSVVRSLLTIVQPVTERTEWTNTMNLTQSLIGIPRIEWKKISQRNKDNMKGSSDMESNVQRILRFCGDSICNLIQDELVPMRYWLPLLELCVGLDSLLDRKDCACLFDKNQAYVLIEAVERVLVVHSNYSILPSNAASNYLSPGSDSRLIEEEENHRSLRLLLLGILSGSVIQANADAGYTRVKNENSIKSVKINDFQKIKSPPHKIKKQNALEMLSVSAFL